MRRRAAAAGVVLALLVAAAGARAHAFLERAEPRVGATLRTAPAEVRLWFTERLEPAYSRVQVVGERGERVDRADAAVAADNGALLRVSLAPLPPGRYKVVWRVVSVDTHVTEGEFAFRVAP
jgi:methionine-rich copper-binding protein CopC